MVVLTNGGSSAGHYDAIITPTWREKKVWRTPGTAMIRLPYINENIRHKAESATKRSNLHVKIVWCTPKSTTSKCTSSALSSLECKKNCPTAPNKCFVKNVVYEIKCGLCGESYIGETGRFLHQRVKEHTANVRRGTTLSEQPFMKHYGTRHEGVEFSGVVTVLRRWRDAADRKLWEAHFISRQNPSINIQKPWILN